MLKIYNEVEKDINGQNANRSKILDWSRVDSGKSFCISEGLFLEARDYVYSNKIENGTCFPVLDLKGKLLFWIQYTENLVLGKKRNDFPDYEKRFLKNENLDFSLLDQYQKFVFTEVEEYSVAIAKLLQKLRPDKKCVFLDKRAKYFIKGESVRFFPFCGIAGRYMELLKKWMQGKNREIGFFNRVICLLLFRAIKRLERKKEVCIVATDKDYFWQTDAVRNSVKLMYSLLWFTNKRTMGDKNEGKTIVLLDYPCFFEGLISIVRWTYTHIKWFEEKGYIPVVDLHAFPNQYLNAETENMWEYFFEPVSKISVQEAHESKTVISAVDNGILLGESKINPYQEKWIKELGDFEEFNKIIRLNAETENCITEKMPKEFLNGKRILGVVMRGTDFRKEVAEKWKKEWRENIVDAEVFLKACNYYKDELKCEYIFLATEDAECFEMVRRIFGEKMLFIDQKRSRYDFVNLERIALNEAMGVEDKKLAGRIYLSSIKSLAECNALIYNVECGAVNMAQCWNVKRYELCCKIKANWSSGH